MMNKKTIALAGNPNVGKSTLFNALTGMHQHTGNWSGKTVDNATGHMKYKNSVFQFVDLPGAYSLHSESPDEKAAGEYIASGKADIILIVADATCLERNLLLICDILAMTRDAILCVNLMDEAKKKGICLDIEKLSQLLGIPVIATAARSKKGLPALLNAIHDFSPHQTAPAESQAINPQNAAAGKPQDENEKMKLSQDESGTAGLRGECGLPADSRKSPQNGTADGLCKKDRAADAQDESPCTPRKQQNKKKPSGIPQNGNKRLENPQNENETTSLQNESAAAMADMQDKSSGTLPVDAQNANSARSARTPLNANEIYAQCVTHDQNNPHRLDRKIDKIVTSKKLGFPIMILLLILIFWLTMVGANYPSAALSAMFGALDEKLRLLMENAALPDMLTSILMDGLYTTLTWVISVMLPPMAIFFPLFTLLEDFGYLPRVAFNLDHAFKRCGAHGKQALTMCMGLGCNACGVTGCRIIQSPRERLIAILTNNFVPCNGRFPTLIAIITIFFAASFAAFRTLASGLMLTAIILLGIAMTLLVSKLLSRTLLKGMPSSFILELPPYRKPKIGSVIIRSILDRTIFVLGRAIVVAAPAGVIIWILANVNAGDTSLLIHCTEFLDPFGRLIGVDGVIIMAFILGFPANEIVVPIMLMCYMSTGMLTDYSSLGQLQEVLTGCGWTAQTALCVLILCLFHFPCGTTCLTIKKETGSLKWTALAFALPTAIGIVFCFLIKLSVLGLHSLF